MKLVAAAVGILFLLNILIVTALKLSVSHIYDHHSPFRPPNCDNVCISEHRMNKLSSDTIASNIPRRQLQVTPYGPTSTSAYPRQYPEHYVAISIGTPEQPVYMLIDTGSGIPWVQCSGCNPCKEQVLPNFDYNQSSSFRSQNIDDPYCGLVQANGYGLGATDISCHHRLNYHDDSYSQGFITLDRFAVSDYDMPGSKIFLENIGFGCGTANVMHVKMWASGVVGLANGEGLSIPEQIDSAIGSQFSYCMAPMESPPNSGYLIFGIGSIPDNGSAYVKTSVLPSPGNVKLWHIDLVSISVNKVTIPLPDEFFSNHGGATVDSGTTFSIVHADAYTLFRDAWRSALQPILGDPGTKAGVFDTCYDYPQDMSLPSISFVFRDGNSFTPLSQGNTYIYFDADQNRRMCWPYLAAPDFPTAFLLGALTQVSVQMIYDSPNSEIGWRYNGC